MQGELPNILSPVSKTDIARVEQEIAERKTEQRSQAAKKGAITRKARRLAAEAQLCLTLIYHAWDKPRGKI